MQRGQKMVRFLQSPIFNGELLLRLESLFRKKALSNAVVILSNNYTIDDES